MKDSSRDGSLKSRGEKRKGKNKDLERVSKELNKANGDLSSR